MDFTTLFTIASLAVKYGPTALSLAEKFGPLAVKLVNATVPVVRDELKAGTLQSAGTDAKTVITAILDNLGHVMTKRDHAVVDGMISEAEHRFARRADGTNEDGTPKFGL